MSPSAPARRVLAPAKLNLGLRVVGRRTDGYHELESLFVPLELADEIEVRAEIALEGKIELRIEGSDQAVVGGSANLAVRAAEAFVEAAGLPHGAHLRLRKRIPVGAGLGGGSSDAGAVLRALAGVFPGRVQAARLHGIALALGADVPFFLDPRPARITGIGEEIEPLGCFPPLDLLLATPGPPLATAEVFRAFDRDAGAALTPAGRGFTMPALAALGSGDRALLMQSLANGLLTNDLEPVARRLRPAIGEARERILAAGARAAGMSGSGPTVFGVFEDAGRAREALSEIRWDSSVQVCVTRVVGAP
jgi:4-diphosphocytidyl-2-C-methyl-D-erythritol kinase